MSSVPDKEKSLAGNLWKAVSFSERNAELIAQKYGLSPLVSSVLTAKGISPDEVGDFITPKLQRLMPEPYVLKDMEIAAERIAKAIQNNEKIGIIGDYDVDGATSTSVLRLFSQRREVLSGQEAHWTQFPQFGQLPQVLQFPQSFSSGILPGTADLAGKLH